MQFYIGLHKKAQAKAAVAASKDAVEQELSALMRAQYHEKQVWSHKMQKCDDVRLVGGAKVNLAVFVELWKRIRLAQTFE